MRDLDAIALTLRCPRVRCQAAPTFSCVTKTGARATRLHSDRTRALREAWRVGYRDGALTAVDHIAVVCNPDRADLDPRGTLERAIKRVRSWMS